MKFRKDFQLTQVQEWASYYVDYTGLKTRIKQTLGKGGSKKPRAQLHQDLENDITVMVERVDQFYTQKYEALTTMVKTYDTILGSSKTVDWTGVNPKELQYFSNAISELHKSFKKLFYFGELNVHAFRKFLHRIHRPVPNEDPFICSQGEQKLSEAQFYSDYSCWNHVRRLENLLVGISEATPTIQPSSTRRRSFLLQSLITQFPEIYGSTIAIEAIEDNNDSILEEFLKDFYDQPDVSSIASGPLITSLLSLSIYWESSSCLAKLLGRIGADCGTETGRSISLLLLELVRKLGREKASLDTRTQQPGANGAVRDRDSPIQLLKQILDWLAPPRQFVLYLSDNFQRLPIHYAAYYGHEDACHALLDKMWAVENPRGYHDSVALWQDSEGNSPLELAVYGGHYAITKMLLEFHNVSNSKTNPADDARLKSMLANLLIIALKSGFRETVDLLLLAGADVNSQGISRESALYIAVQSGNLDIVNLLLGHGARIDAIETANGWTSLFIAAVNGNMEIVKTLIEAGAAQNKCDLRGWTAMDHAAYRGNIKIAKMLRENAHNGSATGVSDTPHNTPAPRRQEPSAQLSPIGESRMIVTLGSFSTSRDETVVDLDGNFTLDSLGLNADDGLAIRSSALGANGPDYHLGLTRFENVIHHPWILTTREPTKVKLIFKIYRALGGELVGSGIALPGELQKSLGQNCDSLVREYKIPILSEKSLDYFGTLTFSLLIVTPFEHIAKSIPARDNLWKEVGPTKVVGHRGRGMNVSAHDHLQIGENTLQSFLSAFKLGASWVELDVQVTKDRVPVVYHDFLASETGTDTWIHNLNLKQFKHLSKTQIQPLQTRAELSARLRPRSHSVGAEADHRITDLNERFQNTYEYGFKKFKANTRGDYIHGSFITLDELLADLPESYPLNIEIKYPMLFEAQEIFKADVFPIEINLFVDTILSHIFEQPSNHSRPIMFSSFSPEICLLVSLKQDKYPILFLTDAGNWPTGDVRTGSLKAAVEFAKTWNLDGVVTASEPLVLAPKLVSHVRNKGLVIASYGGLNNDPVSAKIQADAGLDIIIADNVRLIVETLDGTRPLPDGNGKVDA